MSLYWKCQILGWGLVSLYWLYVSLYTHDYPITPALFNYVLDVAISIALTHTYRTMAVRYHWTSLRGAKLLLILVLSALLLAFCFMIVMNIKWFFFWNPTPYEDIGILEILLYWDPVLITGLRMMSIWLLAYHLYNYHKKELQISRLNAQLVATAKQAQLDHLQTQLNPHFLFNSMNSIKSLIIENPSSARRAIDLLSDLLRSSLDQKDNELILIKDELQLVRDYFELEKIRYEDRLAYRIDIDHALDSYKVPQLPLLITQPLLENAIKHGIDKFINGGTIAICIALKPNGIQIRVTNPGRLKSKGSTGIGLKNLKERLQLQFDGKATFRISETNHNTVAATILIPKTT